jgi:hypothetical protein
LVERSQFGEDGESARSKYAIWVARIKTEFRRKHVRLQPKEAEESRWAEEKEAGYVERSWGRTTAGAAGNGREQQRADFSMIAAPRRVFWVPLLMQLRSLAEGTGSDKVPSSTVHGAQ